MSMEEVGVVLDKNGKAIYWHTPEGRSGGALPDSRELWDFIWMNRENVSGFAHSHPGSGDPVASSTDVSTFDAFERALGRRLDWWIVSEDSLVLYRWEPPTEGSPGAYRWQVRSWGKTIVERRRSGNEPVWAEMLRLASGY